MKNTKPIAPELVAFTEAAIDVQRIKSACVAPFTARPDVIVRGLIQTDCRRAYRAALLTAFS